MMYLTRRYDFSASHRLYNPEFTDARNDEIFRECNNRHGHGHNYELEVTVRGAVDTETGMVIDIVELDALVERWILTRVDHRHFNFDVDFMVGVIPTAENIVVGCWDQLADNIPAPATLHRLRLVESRNNTAEYCGPGQPALTGAL